MTTLRNCLSYLDVQGIRYAHTTHSAAYTAQEVAAAEHLSPHRMAKTIVFKGGDGYLMVVVPADAYVDVAQVRAATGTSAVYRAHEAELSLLFPAAEIGAMPPLGPLFSIPVYLDREVANQEFIAFNAGTHRDSIHMRLSDFIRLVRPIIGDFSRSASHPEATFVAEVA